MKSLVLTSPQTKCKPPVAAEGPPGHRLIGRRWVLNRDWITDADRFAIYLRDNFTCLCCGADLHDYDRREFGLDHLITRFDKGSHKPFNLVTCCRSCNSRRGARPWKHFYSTERQKVVERQRRKKVDVKKAKAYLKAPKQLSLLDGRPKAQLELYFDEF